MLELGLLTRAKVSPLGLMGTEVCIFMQPVQSDRAGFLVKSKGKAATAGHLHECPLQERH